MTEETGAIPESVTSYVLMGGLALSVAFEVIGIALFYAQSGSFNYQFTPQWQMTGPDFFTYTLSLLESAGTYSSPIALMALGVAILMLTSYVRVLTTLLHFAFVKNLKYTAICIFVLLLLTITLYVH